MRQLIFSMIVGKKIKALRKSLKLNQYDFCKFVGVNQSQLSKIERGFQSLDICQICFLSYKFKIDLEWFIGDIKKELLSGRTLELEDFFQSRQDIELLRDHRKED